MRFFATALFALAAVAATAQPTDLLITEYVEGSSFNKAVEVYNGTGAPVDLSGYTLELYSNGSATVSQSAALSGTLADGDVFVVAHGSSDPAILAQADLVSSSVANFNGDDAVVLRGALGVADVVGQVGFDPGSQWSANGVSTENATIRRKAASCTGDTDASDAFDPSVAYEAFPTNTFDGLGAHAAACGAGPGNTPPAFTASLADQTIPAGAAFAFDYDATDADGDALTFALADGPVGATLDPVTGEFAWTPADANQGQAVAVTVTVTDGTATTTTSATLTVASDGPGSRVFFSEYVEGSSNNKALEILNATGGPVDLSAYTVELYFNGATSPGRTETLAGTLAAGDVYVIANASADPAILAVADITSTVTLFNGDDAVVLQGPGGVADAIGQVGFDPGSQWGSGDTSTANATLRRKADACEGDANATDLFDPATLYDAFANDTFGGLGSYDGTCLAGGGGGGAGAPAFTAALADAFVDGGTPIAFDYDAEDPEGDAVTFALVDGPAGATIDPATGVFAWTTSTTGVYAVTVSASDGSASATTTAVVGVRGTLFPGQSGAELRASIRAAYTPDQTLGYAPARDVMYGEIDRAADGTVTGVYTGYSVFLPEGVDPSTYLFENGINAEHTWPQSKGAGDEPARSDIHNLFPAKDNVNSARSNKPLLEIDDAQTDVWYRFTTSTTTPPATDRDSYSESTVFGFEPREVHEGNAARAGVYFYTIYEALADLPFLLEQRDSFVAWDEADPADVAEVVRTYEIARRQGNVNPFLLDDTLLDRAVSDIVPPTPDEVTIAEARQRPDGDLVAVEGLVTRAEGRFIRFEDAGAGLTVFQSSGAVRAAVEDGTIAEGDTLRIVGTMSSFNGLRQINPSAFEVLSRGNDLPTPQLVTLAELVANGEAYESELVRIDGLTVVTDDEVFAANRSYTVTDGTTELTLRTPSADDGLLDGTAVPTGPVAFVGVVGEFRGDYQLVPVLETDLRDDTAPEIVLVEGPFVLTSPNHRMVRFEAADLVASVTDGGTAIDPASVVVVSVSSDEAADATGDGSTATDIVVGCDGFEVRAERSGRGDGRVYTVTLAVADLAGNVGTASFTIGVPKGRKNEAVDSGVAYTVESGCSPAAPAAAMATAPAPMAAASVAASETSLGANAPNPFSTSTDLWFSLAEAGGVRLAVYDVTGREVAVLADGETAAGTHRVTWRPAGLAGGVYLVRMTAGAFSATRQVLLVR
ncbi:lamin tail domain-containing protein [Rubrivirga sp. IMCC45206]|uniref:lamin tail domain-containing protein n=1 Tax=Rubrivirga sp. IMCC45206 TaxID=3391614 RepID=UPI00398FA119